jgi:hypothetical protein
LIKQITYKNEHNILTLNYEIRRQKKSVGKKTIPNPEQNGQYLYTLGSKPGVLKNFLKIPISK